LFSSSFLFSFFGFSFNFLKGGFSSFTSCISGTSSFGFLYTVGDENIVKNGSSFNLPDFKSNSSKAWITV
jgi:hypothetical protein